jgi:membrane associated rhomboid family serine protease
MRTKNIGIQLRSFFASKSFLSRIIFANIALWLAMLLLDVLGFLFMLGQGEAESFMYSIFALSSDVSTVLHRPWTVFTYMFLHSGFFHLLFNMLMLYVGGILYSQYLGQKKLMTTYFASGLAGGVLFILAWNIFPVFSDSTAYAVGASAAVLGVFVAVATYMPNYSVSLLLIGNVKLKYIAIALVVIDFLSIGKGNSGGHIAHLGGALYGFLSVYLPRKVKMPKHKNIFKKVTINKKKTENTFKAERPLSDEEYNRRRAEEQKRIDDILDKISKYGYERLTKEEKEFLFKSSTKR